jgi:hypothetical protein
VKLALLWYELFSGTLQKIGFVLNPYNKRVANCTIAWYVDDMKIPPKDPKVVSGIIEKLESAFRKMSITRGSEHVFLGMHIKYNKLEQTAKITMRDYLKEAISKSGLVIAKAAATPATKDLFKTENSSAKLIVDGDKFHSVVTKLLYVAARARMDLLLAVSFLTTRVSRSTQQDMCKLRRLLEYVSGTLDVEYVVRADNLGRMQTWVDVVYAVHPSHTGGVMSFRRGGLVCKWSK